MIFLLDTNTCIYLIKRRPPEVPRKFEEYIIGDIGVSSVTAAELYFGVQKSQRPAQNRRALEQFLLPLTVIEFGNDAAAYGRVRAALEEPWDAYWPARHAHCRSRRCSGPDAGDQQRSRVRARAGPQGRGLGEHVRGARGALAGEEEGPGGWRR